MQVVTWIACLGPAAALAQTPVATGPTALRKTSPAQVVCLASPTMLQLIGNPVLLPLRRRTEVHADKPTREGASELTVKTRSGQGPAWAIENQRAGGDMIEAGVVLNEHKLVSDGLLELEYGFSLQDKKTGGFPGSADQFHSTTIFLVDSERAMLAITEAQPEFADVLPRVRALLPAVHAAAEWLLLPDVLPKGREHDSPFTHRRWITAAVLGMAGQLTGDASLNESAVAFAKEGLALQQPDGLNPERGGFDVSYEVVDALQGARYYTTLHCRQDAALMQEVRTMMEKTLHWEEGHMLPDGSIDPQGSTRVQKETGRNGAVKRVNYKEIVEAFTYAAMITRDPQYLGMAKKIAASQNMLK